MNDIRMDDIRTRGGFVGRAFRGAVAGAAATAPMTAVMEAGHRALPFWERHSLPPRKLTIRTLRRAGMADEIGEPGRTLATVASHFGYGAACGAIYASVCPARRLGPSTGIAFGLAVWAGSYLGWIPAAGLMTSATRHASRRNLLMIGAHVVYGAALGGVTRSLLRRRDRRGDESACGTAAAEHLVDDERYASVV